MATATDNIQQVRRRIASACEAAMRPVQSVTLVCVGKLHPAAELREAMEAGERDFGENYVQEAIDKMQALDDLRARTVWHLIGPLQSNKTRIVAERFDWVHSVDRLKLAERLSAQRPATLEPLQITLQVNISGEASKSGLALPELREVAQAVARLPRLRLRGLMAIPEPSVGLEAQRRPHAALREQLGALRADGLDLDVLSMGMTDDLEAAVMEGATHVRIGTAIFGLRRPSAA